MNHNNNEPKKSQMDFTALITIQYSTRVDVLKPEAAELQHRAGQIELCLYDITVGLTRIKRQTIAFVE